MTRIICLPSVCNSSYLIQKFSLPLSLYYLVLCKGVIIWLRVFTIIWLAISWQFFIGFKSNFTREEFLKWKTKNISIAIRHCIIRKLWATRLGFCFSFHYFRVRWLIGMPSVTNYTLVIISSWRALAASTVVTNHLNQPTAKYVKFPYSQPHTDSNSPIQFY